MSVYIYIYTHTPSHTHTHTQEHKRRNTIKSMDVYVKVRTNNHVSKTALTDPGKSPLSKTVLELLFCPHWEFFHIWRKVSSIVVSVILQCEYSFPDLAPRANSFLSSFNVKVIHVKNSDNTTHVKLVKSPSPNFSFLNSLFQGNNNSKVY